MREILEKYGYTMVYAVISITLLLFFVDFPKLETIQKLYPNYESAKISDNSSIVEAKRPILEIEETVVLDVDSTFDHLNYVIKATNFDETVDLKNNIKLYYENEADKNKGTIDTSITGSRIVKYVLVYNDITISKEQVVLVKKLGVIE